MPIKTNIPLEYKITNINIDVRTLTIKLEVARGITVNGIFEALNDFTLAIGTEDTQALMSQAVASGTLYSSIKTALQEYLVNTHVVDGVSS
jgi:hypothetical protein